MSANKYIVSGKGFFKELIYGERNIIDQIVWCDNLANAKLFTSNQAQGMIKKLTEIECFIWSPFKEHEKKNKYTVTKRSSSYNFIHDEDHTVLEWMVYKNFESSNDYTQLQNILRNKVPELYSLEEANKIARDRNLKMLEELTKKINEYGD